MPIEPGAGRAADGGDAALEVGLHTRRGFMVALASASGGLLVGMPVFARRWSDSQAHPGRGADLPAPPSTEPRRFRLDPFIEITPSDEVVLYAPCPEIGQGVRTSLSQIVAEELRADWSRVRLRQASAGDEFGPMTVGGSDSVADYWEPLRVAGAVARDRLIGAAAERWSVGRDECEAEAGVVRHEPSGRTARYGELSAHAARLPIRSPAGLTEPEGFRLIGRSVPPVDTRAITSGTAVYGMDVRRPRMRFAAIARPPRPDAGISASDVAAARGIPGVVRVLETPGRVIGGQLYGAVRGGVAVVADNTWAAMRGREALNVR
ncbi:MAG: molybdopterin-dependent oxidoreductase [Gemmatimonadetes bacterium]|nr:molybdopterin-dependent oxidoreductase [Gemmatimonadota bacterium]